MCIPYCQVSGGGVGSNTIVHNFTDFTLCCKNTKRPKEDSSQVTFSLAFPLLVSGRVLAYCALSATV